jgi:hypothetical protein
MIVYVETNFILELAYHQEEHRHCTSILAMAESQEIILVKEHGIAWNSSTSSPWFWNEMRMAW